jgi:MFS superfamily sulfate permease-like transporter
MVGFVGAGIGILTGEDGWRALALGAAVISLLVILPWWNAVTPGSRVGAVLVDVVTLIVVLGWGNRIAESWK